MIKKSVLYCIDDIKKSVAEVLQSKWKKQLKIQYILNEGEESSKADSVDYFYGKCLNCLKSFEGNWSTDTENVMNFVPNQKISENLFKLKLFKYWIKA